MSTGCTISGGGSLPYYRDDGFPREKVCIKKGCYHEGQQQPDHYEHCPHCGEKLDWRVSDMYLDISLDAYPMEECCELPEQETMPDPNKPKEKEEPRRERKHRVSLREFVRMLKKYEEEVFIEDI